MADFKILDTAETTEWNKHLTFLPGEQQDIYFTPEYYQLYEELNDGQAKCFVFEKDRDVALYPFLLNSINQLGYNLNEEYFDIQGAYGYNGVVSSTRDQGFINDFYKTFDQFCNENNIIAEFVRFHPLLGNESFSRNNMTVIKDRETVAIDLTKDHSDIWESGYTSKNRNMIRKAIKQGYVVEILNSPKTEDLDTFIDIYYNSMAAVNAEQYYFFKKGYFTNIFKYMSNNAFLFNVVDPACGVVCAAIFLKYGDYFHYHLSGRKNDSDNSVNNFLIDRTLDFAKKEGAKYFHLGGGRSTSHDDTLLKFKKNFSKQTLTFYIGKKIHNQTIYHQVVEQWAHKYPEKVETYKNHLLKYRY